MRNEIIRKAISSDLLQIAETHIASWQTTYIGLIEQAYLDDLSVDKCKDAWEEALKTQTHHMMVCEQQGQIVGFASYGPSRDHNTPAQCGELYSIYLRKSDQGKGFGTALFNQARLELKSIGYLQMIVWVLASNHSARQFYQSMGCNADGGEKTLTIWERDLLELRYRIDL